MLCPKIFKFSKGLVENSFFFSRFSCILDGPRNSQKHIFSSTPAVAVKKNIFYKKNNSRTNLDKFRGYEGAEKTKEEENLFAETSE